MKNEKKHKKFLNLPQYPGGKEAFKLFVKENLRYPEEALKLKIEGIVYISYQVSDNGEVVEAHVTKGIGHGCDEEAIRVVKLLTFEKVKNRGVRLISSMKTSINFKLNEAKQAVKFNYVSSPEKKEEKSEPQKQVYGYTISFTRPD